MTKENRTTTNNDDVKGTTPTKKNGETRATDTQATNSTLAILDDKSSYSENTTSANNSGTTLPYNNMDDE